MKLNPGGRRLRRPRQESVASSLLWWMPLAGLAAALCWASWSAVQEDDTGLGEVAGTFGLALVWPGLIIFVVTTAIVWLAWKVDLD